MKAFDNSIQRIASITVACAVVISLAGCATSGNTSDNDSSDKNISVKAQSAADDDIDATTFTVDETGNTVIQDQAADEQTGVEDEEPIIDETLPSEDEIIYKLDTPRNASAIPDNISADQLQSAFEMDSETAKQIELSPESERRQAVYDYAEKSPLLDVDYESEVPAILNPYAAKTISVIGDGGSIESQTLTFNTLEETKAAYDDLCAKYGEERIILESIIEDYADENSVPDLSDEEWERLFADVDIEEVTFDGETFVKEVPDNGAIEENAEDNFDELSTEDVVVDDTDTNEEFAIEDISLDDLEPGEESTEPFATTVVGDKKKNPGLSAMNLPAAANLLEACTADKPVTIAIVEINGINTSHNASKHVTIDSTSARVGLTGDSISVPSDKINDYTYIYNDLLNYKQGAKIGTSNYKYWKDTKGHGTGVLSVVAAGVPKGSRILLIKPTTASSLNVICCFKYARDRGAKVVNASLGGIKNLKESKVLMGIYEVMGNDFEKRNMMLVVSAGNDNRQITTSKSKVYPAALSTAVTVGAVDSSKKRAKFSNYGNEVDFAAPGQSMVIADKKSNKSYRYGSGTSFAAPAVTAFAANLYSLYPGKTRAQIQSIMQGMSKDLGTKGKDKYYGYGFPVFNLSKIPFSINYKNLNGLTAPSKKSYNTTAAVTLSAPGGKKTGYTFVGWYTSTKSSAKKVTKIAKGSKGNVTVYARFKANTYNIAFKANGGSGSMSAQKLTYNKAAVLDANKFKRTGYTFTGWNTKANGKGKAYKNKASVKNLAGSGTVTLYATWKANTYKVVFKANGGKGKMSEQSFTYNKTAALGENKFTRVGYKFVGWNTKADGTGKSYKNKASVKNIAASGTTTLYAIWKSKEAPFSTTAPVSTSSPVSTPAVSNMKVSIKTGWVALDSKKNIILQGSKYKASDSPVAYIWNQKELVPVSAGSVVYLRNSKTGKAQALVLGDKINGYKDAFITTFQIT